MSPMLTLAPLQGTFPAPASILSRLFWSWSPWGQNWLRHSWLYWRGYYPLFCHCRILILKCCFSFEIRGINLNFYFWFPDNLAKIHSLVPYLLSTSSDLENFHVFTPIHFDLLHFSFHFPSIFFSSPKTHRAKKTTRLLFHCFWLGLTGDANMFWCWCYFCVWTNCLLLYVVSGSQNSRELCLFSRPLRRRTWHLADTQ